MTRNYSVVLTQRPEREYHAPKQGEPLPLIILKKGANGSDMKDPFQRTGWYNVSWYGGAGHRNGNFIPADA